MKLIWFISTFSSTRNILINAEENAWIFKIYLSATSHIEGGDRLYINPIFAFVIAEQCV